MSILVVAIIAGGVATALSGAAAWLMWRRTDDEDRQLVKRITRLPFRAKLRLAVAMARDRRVPLAVRGIPPGLILYLSVPIDLIPDFIPVLGHVDDVIILVIGIGLLLRFTPRAVLEEHVASFEAAS